MPFPSCDIQYIEQTGRRQDLPWANAGGCEFEGIHRLHDGLSGADLESLDIVLEFGSDDSELE